MEFEQVCKGEKFILWVFSMNIIMFPLNSKVEAFIDAHGLRFGIS